MLDIIRFLETELEVNQYFYHREPNYSLYDVSVKEWLDDEILGFVITTEDGSENGKVYIFRMNDYEGLRMEEELDFPNYKNLEIFIDLESGNYMTKEDLIEDFCLLIKAGEIDGSTTLNQYIDSCKDKNGTLSQVY